jgi:nicotinamidase-related amidase
MTDASSALMTLHMQEFVIDNCGPRGLAAVGRLDEAAAAARSAGIPVIHVRMAFRPGLVDVVPAARTSPFSMNFEEGAPGARLHSALGPREGDIDVVSKRASGFKGSDLPSLLATLGARHLVVGGIGTSGTVLATVLEGADLSFGITVLADACADPDLELHEMLLGRVLPVRSQVVSVSEWIAALAD